MSRLKIDVKPAVLATDIQADIDAAKAEPVGKPSDWAIESYLLARENAYKGVPPAPATAAHKNDDVADLGQPYLIEAKPVVSRQIARGGVRLAVALKQALP